jgi:hypothetical protein
VSGIKVVNDPNMNKRIESGFLAKYIYHPPPKGFYSLLTLNGQESRDNIYKVLYLALQTADLGMTMMAAYAGYAELNPFVHSLLASPFHMILIKILIPLVIVILIPGRFLIPAVAMQAFIIMWNLKELFLLML